MDKGGLDRSNLPGGQARTLRNGFHAVKHMLFAVACWRGEDKGTVQTPHVLAELIDQFRRGWHLPLFPALGIEVGVRLAVTRTVRSARFTSLQKKVYDLLFTKSGQ